MTFLGSPRGKPGRGGSEPGLPEPALPAEVAQCPLHCNVPHRNLLLLAKGSGKQVFRVLIPDQEACKGAFLPCKSLCAVEDEIQGM